MSFLSKLQFWKKNDDLPFSDDMDSKLHLPDIDGGYGQQTPSSMPPMDSGFSRPHSFSQPSPPLFQQQQFQQQQPGKDMELIEAKLDTIRSMLDSINQRLANLERIARE